MKLIALLATPFPARAKHPLQPAAIMIFFLKNRR